MPERGAPLRMERSTARRIRPHPNQAGRAMKKLLAGLAGVAIIVAIGAALAHYLSLNQVAGRAIAQYGSAVTGVKVSVNRVQISRAKGTGSITGLAVGNPAGFSTATAIAAPSIRITLEAFSPDKQAIRLRTVSVAIPHFSYEWSRDGSNFEKLLENIRLHADKGDKKRDKEGAPDRRLVVGRLILHSAKLSYASPANPGRMITVDLPPEIRVTPIGRTGGGATTSEFATAILETLIYHIKRKIPESALHGAAVTPAKTGAHAGK